MRAALGYIPWRTSSHSGGAAYGGRGVRPGYMPTMPPEGWDRQRSGAGGAPGAAATARTKAGGADGLVEALAEGQSRRSGGTSADWGQRSGTGRGPAPKDMEGPAGGVMSRLRCGRSSDSDGRDLRFARPVQPAG
jgi:hypothetical protein